MERSSPSLACRGGSGLLLLSWSTMGTRTRTVGVRQRVARAAEIVLELNRAVTPIDVLGFMGWLPEPFVIQWRQGRRPHLEDSISAAPARVAEALRLLED